MLANDQMSNAVCSKSSACTPKNTSSALYHNVEIGLSSTKFEAQTAKPTSAILAQLLGTCSKMFCIDRSRCTSLWECKWRRPINV